MAQQVVDGADAEIPPRAAWPPSCRRRSPAGRSAWPRLLDPDQQRVAAMAGVVASPTRCPGGGGAHGRRSASPTCRRRPAPISTVTSSPPAAEQQVDQPAARGGRRRRSTISTSSPAMPRPSPGLTGARPRQRLLGRHPHRAVRAPAAAAAIV